MKIYSISYNGQNTDALFPAICQYPEHCRVMHSQWFVCSDESASDICKNIRAAIGKNDFLLVSEITPNHAGWLDSSVLDWLERVLPKSSLPSM